MHPEWPPIARNVDPATSHAAADKLTKSGKRSRRRDQVLACVQQTPGQNAYEIAQATGYVNAWKRLSELLNDGLVRQGPAKLAPTGVSQLTWFPVEPTQGALRL